MERGRSALPSIQDLIPFPCSVRMGSDWSSSLIEMRSNPVNLIYSLLTGFLKLIRNRLQYRVGNIASQIVKKELPMRIAYFDCFSGASGDMILGSLLDAGLNPRLLREELKKLRKIGRAS